jgi:phosphatidylglycerol lysyltransferase
VSAQSKPPLTLVAEQGSLEPIPDVASDGRPRPAWLRYLGPTLALAVLALALLVLQHMAEDIHLSEVADALRSATWGQIALAVAATALSFAALAAYDVLAVRSCIQEPVGLGTALFAGAAGYAVSNALGFPVLTGGSVRYRIYSAVGLGAADIGRIVAIAWLTLLLGLVSVVGLAMALDPAGIATLTTLPAGAARGIGLALVAGMIAFVAWVASGLRCLCLFGWSIPMPDGRTAVAQLVAGSVDFAAAAATLYVLLPAGATPEPGAFLVVFAAAIALGIVAHTPGGIGVFEATIAAGLGMTGRPDLVAALILYRVIYSLLPLAVAALALLGVELARRRSQIAAVRRLLNGMLQGVVPAVAGGLVLIGGVVLLVSSSIPRQPWRVDLLSDLVPLPFVEATHLLGSLAGVLLMVVARGLFARLAPAWWAAMALLAAGMVFSMAKGIDWEEAAILLSFIGFLAFFRELFYRPGHLEDLRPGLRWLSLVTGLLIVVAWVGFFVYRHVEYSNDLWWEFAWQGDAPRFLRAGLAVAIVAAVALADTLFNRPLPARKDPEQIPPVVRRLVAEAPRALASLALLGDKRFLLTEAERAFIMYGVSGRSWVSLGGAIGEAGDARELIWRFRELADRHAGRVVFYGVSTDELPLYLDMGLALHKIGEVARLDLSSFSLQGPARQELRYVDRRATKEGLEFSVLPKEAVTQVMEELRGVSDAWLAGKKASEKGFSLGAFRPDYLSELDCAVLRKDGRIVAFANLMRSGGRAELAIDLMRYEAGASKILMDALFVRVALYAKEQGYAWFNLGAAPLSGLAEHRLAPTWHKVGSLIFRRGEEFYPFEGLRAYKQKFNPVWTPHYLACRGGLALPQILVDVAALIAGGRLEMIKK